MGNCACVFQCIQCVVLWLGDVSGPLSDESGGMLDRALASVS